MHKTMYLPCGGEANFDHSSGISYRCELCGAVHFYGHVHGKPTGLEQYRARDAAFDATGRVVSDLDVMIADALKGQIREHH